MKYNTIREAAEAWVKEFSAIPQSLIEKAYMGDNIDSITEITPISINDRVYHYDKGEYGYITDMTEDGNFIVELGNGEKIEAEAEDMEADRDSFLPMWGTMWMFGDSCDEWWITDREENGLQIMANCGFRIYEIDEGIIFGIDGAGYSFYDEHWIPLYKARGLQWHETEEETEVA